MSFFTPPLSQLGTAHLQELLAISAVENVRLEFKRDVPDKDETLKKLSSFGNTFGGHMVIGASANSADGRIADLPGVDPQPGYKQKIVQWSFDAVSPQLTVEVSDPIPTPANNGKVCYVVYVAESDLAPHFLNGRKGVWIRTDEFSQRFEAHLANENELRHLFDRRRLVRERREWLLQRARQRFDTSIAKRHTDLSGNRTRFGASLEFSVIPRFPSRQLCGQELLKPYIQQSTTTHRGNRFPDPSTILSQHESAIVLNAVRGVPITSMFEVNVWGLLFYGSQIERDHNKSVGIHLYEFVGRILLFILHAGEMLQRFGYSGSIRIDIKLRSLRSVPWLQPMEGWLEPSTGSELDDEVAFSISTTSEALLQKPDAVAMDVLRYVLFAVDRSSMLENPTNLANLIRRGYEFIGLPWKEEERELRV
jgi:hypothetical protein